MCMRGTKNFQNCRDSEMSDTVHQIADTIRAAAEAKRPLRIRGGGSKDFYGNESSGDLLDVSAYSGIIDYQPTELVITARAGTPLAGIEAVMRERGQMLGFEPPHFSGGATIGGCIAAGLSGPRRPYAGSVRDFVLGMRMLDGNGTDLAFGGQVMKNVAGYDVSRLMTGSLGTLGVILEVSLKTLPLPPVELTICQEQTPAEAITLMNTWAGKPLPITATCHMDNRLYVRLSGAVTAVKSAARKLGGDELSDDADFWRSIRDHQRTYFTGITETMPLWRVSLQSTTPALDLPGAQVIEWGGALRWFKSDVDAMTIRQTARKGDGHATRFHGGSSGAFHPLPEALMRLHRRVKQAMDPAGILNPGRLYEGL